MALKVSVVVLLLLLVGFAMPARAQSWECDIIPGQTCDVDGDSITLSVEAGTNTREDMYVPNPHTLAMAVRAVSNLDAVMVDFKTIPNGYTQQSQGISLQWDGGYFDVRILSEYEDLHLVIKHATGNRHYQNISSLSSSSNIVVAVEIEGGVATLTVGGISIGNFDNIGNVDTLAIYAGNWQGTAYTVEAEVLQPASTTTPSAIPAVTFDMTNLISTTQTLANEQTLAWSPDSDIGTFFLSLGSLVTGSFVFMFIRVLVLWRHGD